MAVKFFPETIYMVQGFGISISDTYTEILTLILSGFFRFIFSMEGFNSLFYSEFPLSCHCSNERY